jgi:hypothetical protein
LCDIDDVQTLLDTNSGGTVFVFVSLAKVCIILYFINFIKRIFGAEQKKMSLTFINQNGDCLIATKNSAE